MVFKSGGLVLFSHPLFRASSAAWQVGLQWKFFQQVQLYHDRLTRAAGLQFAGAGASE